MNAFLKGIVNIFSGLYRIKVYGKENIPEGKALLICNHFRGIDCAFVLKIYDKDIKFVAKKELFRKKLQANVLKKLGAIPINRENPEPSSIIKIIRYLKEGHKVCIFPEGTRNKTKTNILQETKEGYILFALKSQCPICPIMFEKKTKLFNRTKMIVGKPIYLDEYYDKKADKDVLCEINEKIRKILINQQEIMSDISREK